MKRKIILIGGGGHCRSCIDVIEQHGDFTIAGIVDLPEKIGQKVFNYTINCLDYDIIELISKGHSFLVTIGQIKSFEKRVQIFSELSDAKASTPAIISPFAYVSKHAQVGPGSIIMHGAIVNAGAAIGSNCIINSRALVEHDVIVDDHCHISTAATINGGAMICAKSFIGSQAMIREGITIGPESIVGARSSIMKSIDAKSIIKG